MRKIDCPHSIIMHTVSMMEAIPPDPRRPIKPEEDIEGIEIGFLNFGYMFIPYRYIASFQVEGITESYFFHACGERVQREKTSKYSNLWISAEMANYAYLGFDAEDKETVFERLLDQWDIARFTVKYYDGSAETFLPVYKEEGENRENKYQRVKLDEDVGVLSIEISEQNDEVEKDKPADAEENEDIFNGLFDSEDDDDEESYFVDSRDGQ